MSSFTVFIYIDTAIIERKVPTEASICLLPYFIGDILILSDMKLKTLRLMIQGSFLFFLSRIF